MLMHETSSWVFGHALSLLVVGSAWRYGNQRAHLRKSPSRLYILTSDDIGRCWTTSVSNGSSF